MLQTAMHHGGLVRAGVGNVAHNPPPIQAQLGMPSEMMALFNPRPELAFKPPMPRRVNPAYGGVGACTALFEDPEEMDEDDIADVPKPPESRDTQKEQFRKSIQVCILTWGREKLRKWSQIRGIYERESVQCRLW